MGDRIILIDNDRNFLERLSEKLNDIGFCNLILMDRATDAIAAFEQGELFDLALIDMTMSEMDGLTLLDRIKNTSPGTECIMVTAVNEARTAVECLRKGAIDYLVKPVTKSVLALTLPRALERKRLLDILDMEKRRHHGELSNPEPFSPIITQAPLMQRVLREAELHAASNVPILITGESGTGKELLAWAIHAASPRASHPFTPINMASISANLFEAEFFGHTRGAFSGATNQRRGFLEHTHPGTLFLDEIGDLPMDLQGKLLRVLQEGEFSRVGSTERVLVDLRFIAATNEDLDDMMRRKAFRKDLYYRIRGGWLHLPPLRERSGDINLLTQYFLNKYANKNHLPQPITDEALSVLTTYSWPGNVRELKSVIQSMVNLAYGSTISIAHLPQHLQTIDSAAVPILQTVVDSRFRPLADVEREHILNTYEALNQNKSKTARALKIGLNTLRRKLAEYDRT